MSKRKIASVALVALLVAGLATAATAQAELEFETVQVVESEGYEEEVPVHSSLDATQVEGEPIKFSVGGLPITCTTATATSTLAKGASPTLTLSPAFSKCKSIFFPAQISMNGCGYTVHGLSEIEADLYKAYADITCPAGKEIAITIKNFAETKTKCVIHVPPQINRTTVKAQNITEASPEDMTLKNELKEISAVVTKGEEACVLTPGSYFNGELTGKTTVTATGAGEVPPVPKINPRKFHFGLEEVGVESILEVSAVGPVQEFGFDIGKVKCTEMLLQETFSVKSPVLPAMTIGGTFGSCKYGGLSAAVEFNGCRYSFTAHKIEFGDFVGRTAITCFIPGETIEVNTGANCTVSMPAQSGLKGVLFFNAGAGASREINASIAIKSLRYSESGAGCVGKGETKNGTYVGAMLFKAGVLGGLQYGLWNETTQ